MTAYAVDEPIDPGVLRDVVEELEEQLVGVRTALDDLHRHHERALVLQRLYDGAPVTHERLAYLQANIQGYAARHAALREEERWLTRWIDRARTITPR